MCFSLLDGNEINQLQERLASTELQMCKILTALDSASDRVAGMTKPSTVKPPLDPSSPSSDDENQEENEQCSPSLSSNSNHHSSAEEDEDEDDQTIPVINGKQKEE